MISFLVNIKTVLVSGAYTHSSGIELVRQNCAKYIERRDGYPCNASDISLTGGASEGVKVQLVQIL